MALPYEDEIATNIKSEHETVLNAMRETLSTAVILLSETSLSSDLRGVDRHVCAMTLGLYAKACKTHRSIQHLLAAGLTSDAEALLRVLFETTVAIHFILKKQSALRSRMYGMFPLVQAAKASRGWQRTKGMKRLGKSLAKNSDGVLRDSVSTFAKRLSSVRSAHPFGPAIAPTAMAFVKAKTPQARDSALSAAVKAVADALNRHWSGQSLEYASSGRDLSRLYQSVFRSTSSSTHASDITSHISSPDTAYEIVVNLAPDGEQVPRTANTARFLLWLAAKRINERFRLGKEASIQAAQPRVV